MGVASRDFLINSIHLVDINGSTNIPTVLLYRSDGLSFGSDALSKDQSKEALNEDFKVDLGNSRPGTSSLARFTCGDGKDRSAAELTSDFIHQVILRVSGWMSSQDIKPSDSILVAEPLRMQEGLVSEDWLVNYRSYIRRILLGKGFNKIEFLPEPFAVYQYYRYGVKHPIVAERRRHNALVIDFGGGTFDVCLIQTTKDGDVSEGGRLAKPVSASSEPAGGFFVNRAIAEEVTRKLLAPKNIGAKLKTAFNLYRQWRRGEIGLSTLSAENRNFIQRQHQLVYRIEEAKLALCRMMRNWSLDDVQNLSVPITVPNDPFVASTDMVSVQFSAGEFRALFRSKIWEPHLRPAVKLALQRGIEELNGAPITVVLLSGGSANIRWIVDLLQHDFPAELNGSEILQLADFQEVVSKGLAVECARRFYTGERQGDFGAVTYNRLCALFDPDESGLALKRFKPLDSSIPVIDIPGVLLPSASAIGRLKNKPLRWRVHLDHAPRRRLDYYFLRSSFDPNDTVNLQNIEEHMIFTPVKGRLDCDLTVELTIADDGTATPRFIYRQGRTEGETIAQTGRPFYLDSTTGDDQGSAESFVGLDFGTSNTSVSFVDERAIQTFKRRSIEKSWNELSDLSSTLPFPLACPLANYLCQTEPHRLAEAAREFLESSLTIAAYLVYLEYCTNKGRSETRLFKNFTKRSAGPLWNLFQTCMKQGHPTDLCGSAYSSLLEPELFREIDQAVNVVTQHKHGKASEGSAHILRPVQILANVSQQVFSCSTFGYFQQVQKQRFGARYQGIFRHAHGRPAFVETSKYSGNIAFSDNETYIVNTEVNRAISLEPLILWEQCNKHPDLENGHCYIFDSEERDGSFTYKAIGHTCVLVVTSGGQLSELHERIAGLRVCDKEVCPIEVELKRETADR